MQPIEHEIKKENKIVSDWLLYYPERLQDYKNQQDEVALYPSSEAKDEIRGKGQTPDPTGQAVVRRLQNKYDPRWFELIAELERRIPEKQKVFLEVRREAKYHRGRRRGRPAWITYVQCKYPLVMAERTGKSVECFYIAGQNTCTLWWNRLVEHTARLATKRGLL